MSDADSVDSVRALPSDGRDICEVPPAGWYCTRAPGHEGPCAALPDPVVGHGTLEDGTHIPIRQRFAEQLCQRVEEARQKRQQDMPDEQAAIRQMCDAHERLKDFGWKDPVYAPKDGSPLDILELGSSGIHRGHYDGEWPTGSWWIVDGDIWPTRPAMARAAADAPNPDPTPQDPHPSKDQTDG